MIASLIVRASNGWRKPADLTLGEHHHALRRARYAHEVRAAGLHRDPEHPLRVRAGLSLQRELCRRPIPRRRALVVAGPLIRCEHTLPQ